jgi:hypothetical protein
MTFVGSSDVASMSNVKKKKKLPEVMKITKKIRCNEEEVRWKFPLDHAQGRGVLLINTLVRIKRDQMAWGNSKN